MWNLMKQVTQTGALGQPRGMEWGEGFRMGGSNTLEADLC